ncbi:regulatory protein RecX [Flavobacterium sp.]|uniref:regulatory protein RecX n=1 Tax=Flavobacterium sp. TaxID=239 RepID=UPI002B4B70ED|nr:regulatory protein RecX [Flavobacterium sp.]HLF52342.1 regulatory protein RecX [Flavobacterium sp.]
MQNEKTFTFEEIKKKLEHYCAYQERCHNEVVQKLKTMTISETVSDTVIVHLIENKYLNEERFACSFARGKHRIKHWGKIRIVNELKFRKISQYNINTALKEITLEEYSASFHSLAEKQWETIKERSLPKKKKKFCDFLLRKGFESHLIYDKVNELAR